MNTIDYIQKFQDLFLRATAAIPEKYFKLSVATNNENKPTSIYRERVYCYELYHQMRTISPDYILNGCLICGEVDKSGHPLKIKDCIPDFLVHHPGNMSNNLVIIEVKALKNSSIEIEGDLEKLIIFQRDYHYIDGFYLFYGDNEKIFNTIKENIRNLIREKWDNDLCKIKLFHHKNHGIPAEPIEW